MTAVFRRPMQFIKYMFGSSGTSSKTFGNIMDEHVTHPDVRKLITMITEGTTSAAPAEIDATYMLRAFHEMWSQNTVLQYPAVCYLPVFYFILSSHERQRDAPDANCSVTRKSVSSITASSPKCFLHEVLF